MQLHFAWPKQLINVVLELPRRCESQRRCNLFNQKSRQKKKKFDINFSRHSPRVRPSSSSSSSSRIVWARAVIAVVGGTGELLSPRESLYILIGDFFFFLINIIWIVVVSCSDDDCTRLRVAIRNGRGATTARLPPPSHRYPLAPDV